MEYRLKFSAQEVNLIAAALAVQPYKDVAQVMQSLQVQVKQQEAPPPAENPPPVN